MTRSREQHVDTVSASEARALLMLGQALLEDPARKATATSVCRCIERMGFVQVDTINIVERAHHHILMSLAPTMVWHDGIHQGQLIEVRRVLGLPRVFG